MMVASLDTAPLLPAGLGDTGKGTVGNGHSVHGLALLQHGQKLKASSSRQAALWVWAGRQPTALPLQPPLLRPAAPAARHIVCHSDRFKQTRLGLIRLRLRFLQRFAGAGLRKAAGRQQKGGQALAGRGYPPLGRGKRQVGTPPVPPNRCPSANTVGAGRCPGWPRAPSQEQEAAGGCAARPDPGPDGCCHLVHGRLLPRTPPSSPNPPQKLRPKAPKSRWHPPGNSIGSRQRGEKQATTSK